MLIFMDMCISNLKNQIGFSRINSCRQEMSTPIKHSLNLNIISTAASPNADGHIVSDALALIRCSSYFSGKHPDWG